MELRVECAEGSDLPPGCYVGVRVGDVLKQGRYEPQRCYNFPAVDRRRNAKIDVYRHVGSTVVAIDPDAKSLHEVSVPSSDPTCSGMTLKVSVQSNAVDAGKAREARTKAVKNQAKDYLSKYSVEEKLSEAVKALLREQPSNPTEFICRHLMVNDGGVMPSSPLGGASTQAPVQSNLASPAPKPSGKAAIQPKSEMDVLRENAFNTLTEGAKKGDLQRVLQEKAVTLTQDANTQDIDAIRIKARDVLVQACQDGGLQDALRDVNQQVAGTGSSYANRPSVGTWLQKAPTGPKKVKVWNKLPSVGTWLARPAEIEAEPDSSRIHIVQASSLMGPQFYSMGLSNLPKAF